MHISPLTPADKLSPLRPLIITSVPIAAGPALYTLNFFSRLPVTGAEHSVMPYEFRSGKFMLKKKSKHALLIGAAPNFKILHSSKPISLWILWNTRNYWRF